MSLTNSTFIQNPISASIAGIALSSILLSGNALMSLLVGMIAGGRKFFSSKSELDFSNKRSSSNTYNAWY